MTKGESAKCLKKESVDKNEANNAKRSTNVMALKASTEKKGTQNSSNFCTIIAQKKFTCKKKSSYM